MIKAGIFDVGGVLHDDALENILEDIRTFFNLDHTTLQAAVADPLQLLGKGKITEAEFWERFTTAANVHKPLPTPSLFLRSFIEQYGLHQDVIDIVQTLHEQGYTTAVLSNTILPHAEYHLKAGLYQHFDVLVLSHEVGLEKPDPAIFMYTLEKLGAAPAEVFFVDDREKNTTAAQELGIHSILYRDPQALREEIIKLGVPI